MNIYTRLNPIKEIIDSNPEIIQTIKTVYSDTENKNPSVRNMEFRKLFESFGVLYHKQGYSPKEIFWRTINNDWEDHFCVVCGVLIDSKKFDTKHCSLKCSGRNPDTLLTRINTTQERFGVENVFQSELIQKTMRETCQEKYGTDRYQQTAMFSIQLKEITASWSPEHKKEIHSKKIDTWQKNYGVDHCQKSPEIQNKTKQTNLERYGVEYVFQNTEVKEKAKQTNLERHGVENPMHLDEFKEKIKFTNLERYGVEYVFQNTEVKEKAKQTNLERYGVEYISQCPEIHGRQVSGGYKSKTYTFPSGNSYLVQGHEPKAIDQLLWEGYTEDQIQLTNRPTIRYFWSSQDGYGDDKWHVYYPDIIIPHESKIIEVKSKWTYDGCGKKLDWRSKNLAKKEGAILSGYSFEFMLF